MARSLQRMAVFLSNFASRPFAFAPTRTSFTLRAKATDTGGNSTWSQEVVVRLTPDTTPPVIRSIFPRRAAVVVDTITVTFSEAMDPATASASTIQVFAAGADGKPGTADDQLVTGGSVSLSTDQTIATLRFPTPLLLGSYRAVVKGNIADLRGNRLGADVVNDFRVIDAVYWINPGGGDWNNPANWSTGKLPGPDDDVLIATPLPNYVYHSRGENRIKSLVVENPLLLNGGKLAIGGPLRIAHLFIMAAGTLEGAQVSIDPDAPAAGFQSSFGRVGRPDLCERPHPRERRRHRSS